MTMQHAINITSANVPQRVTMVRRIVSDSQADIKVRNVFADFVVHISPLFSERSGYQLLARLADFLPRGMSRTHVEQLRARFPQPPATDDPATYEFETHKD